jgi:lipoate-protein ligase A
LFYSNSAAIIVGRNQNTNEEIASDVVAANGIQVVRRVSGGGAVFHDAGNLCFSFMTREINERFNRYDTFNQPVLAVLHDLGVPAELSGRNDIIVNWPQNLRVMRNLLLLTACSAMAPCWLILTSMPSRWRLRPKPGKVESEGVKSVRSRVANINEFLDTPITATELRERILEKYLAPVIVPTSPPCPTVPPIGTGSRR